jgi:hypothetical protein
MISKIFLTFLVFLFSITVIYAQDNAIPIEAEDADSLGSDFNIVTEGNITFITPLTDFASSTSPGTPDKVATYKITFDAPGTYDLYVKLRVGPQAWDDDSFYFASSFGTRPADIDSLWIRVNNIGNGAANPDEYVLGPDENSAGNEIFKWINASETGEGAAGGTLFIVEAEDSLNQIFQIGSRENGLDIDKIAFGNADLFYTVSNLENGEAGVTEIPENNNMLIVDLSDSLRPITHCATGALYGVTETIPGDIDNLVAPLHPRMYVQPARSGAGYQQPYGAALPVSERLVSTTAEVTIRLADICPSWPYQWPGWESWSSEVTSVINDKLESGRNNYYGYEIWNEHHGTWDEETNGDFFTQLWKPSYDLIRSLDSTAKIIGPSDSYYTSSRIEEFLTFCNENDCLPDIICWHELGGSANITSHVESYRSLEHNLRISPREISINEYSSSTHEYEGCPGVSAPFIAKFERNLVNSASISWWFTNLPGRLGSLLTAGNEKGGGWWFYKWYGDMTGNMVSVTPPNDYSDGIDGFACLDPNAQYASICLGGDDTGTFDVRIDGIPSSFGDTVYAKVEYVPWTSKDTPVSGPTIVSNTVYSVSDGSITVPVDVTSPLYGYRVYISPTNTVTLVDNSTNMVPTAYSLSQNYPNPFNPTTNIEYSIPVSGQISLKVYNSLGQIVATLFEGHQKAGKHVAKFNASGLASGVYIYRLESGNTYLAKKFILMK